ncbi:triacylglycerol lipase [Aquabacterium sp.]|uniref:lipase family alpha/beta hydrolase n=1 Tax=Aquabacterium sp. TaxID=1872578 RepID=UPI0025B9A9FE|nr:triacylglycerol lipase [Aquabacterium sp.]
MSHFVQSPRSWLRAMLLGCAALLGLLSHTTASAATGTQEAATRYPIVLVHGFMGFKDIFGVDYFYQVPALLRKNGAKVYVAAVSEVNSSSLRGEQLLQQMKQWSAKDGVTKFNLIGHSQGGPTIRYVAGVAPQMVASVTSIAGPTIVTDAQAAESNINKLITNYASMVEFAGSFVAWISGNGSLPQDASALTLKAELDDFAKRFPAGLPATYCGEGAPVVAGIRYYSATGQGVKTNAWDISDLAMQQTVEPGDGAIIACAAHLGKVIRDDYPWNHIDEMNHIFGLIGKGAPDPAQFYLTHATRLRLAGV